MRSARLGTIATHDVALDDILLDQAEIADVHDSSANELLSVHVATAFPWSDSFQTGRIAVERIQELRTKRQLWDRSCHLRGAWSITYSWAMNHCTMARCELPARATFPLHHGILAIFSITS